MVRWSARNLLMPTSWVRVLGAAFHFHLVLPRLGLHCSDSKTKTWRKVRGVGIRPHDHHGHPRLARYCVPLQHPPVYINIVILCNTGSIFLRSNLNLSDFFRPVTVFLGGGYRKTDWEKKSCSNLAHLSNKANHHFPIFVKVLSSMGDGSFICFFSCYISWWQD